MVSALRKGWQAYAPHTCTQLFYLYTAVLNISVNNFTQCHIITDVHHSDAAHIRAFTLIVAYDMPVLMWPNQSFTSKRVPLPGNCRHDKTSSWAAVQTDSRQGDTEGSSFGGCEVDVHLDYSVTATGVQWHALGDISGRYMEIRYPVIRSYNIKYIIY